MREYRSLLKYFSVYLLLITGCTTTGKIITPEKENDIRYSIIYVIHADANYLYHENDGTARRADEKALEEARRIGERASDGEVFIYRQLPERKFLWLFPRKNRELVLYRNGKQAGKERYHPDESGRRLYSAETEMFHQYSQITNGENIPSYFLYFGHEIPSEGGRGYHHSFPDVPVNMEEFTNGLRGFLPDSTAAFSLVVLSSCNNGTPHTAAKMADIAEFVLASPQNLHLSHIDTKALSLLEKDSIPAGDQLASAMAEDTFQRLSESVETSITLSLYDMNRIQPYISVLNEIHNEHTGKNDSFEDNIDCAQRSFFNKSDYSEGVQLWYRPPKFGRQAEQESHSGWGCRPGS